MRVVLLMMISLIFHSIGIAQYRQKLLLSHNDPQYQFMIYKNDIPSRPDSFSIKVQFINKTKLNLSYSEFTSSIDYDSKVLGKKIESVMDFEMKDPHITDRSVRIKDTFRREVELDTNFITLTYRLRIYNQDSLIKHLKKLGKNIKVLDYDGSQSFYYSTESSERPYLDNCIFFDFTIEDLFKPEPFITGFKVDNKLFPSFIKDRDR